MSTRPAGLGDRFNRRLSGINTRQLRMDAGQAERDAAAGAERARTVEAAVMTRIYHPVIEAPEFKCYRVIRRWKGEDPEDIGFSRDQATAIALMNRELGWAIVLDPQGKRIAHNWQLMTEKPE